MGYKFQFVTLAGFHSLNHGMFELSQGYAKRGMAAYAELQQVRAPRSALTVPPVLTHGWQDGQRACSSASMAPAAVVVGHVCHGAAQIDVRPVHSVAFELYGRKVVCRRCILLLCALPLVRYAVAGHRQLHWSSV